MMLYKIMDWLDAGSKPVRVLKTLLIIAPGLLVMAPVMYVAVLMVRLRFDLRVADEDDA